MIQEFFNDEIQLSEKELELFEFEIKTVGTKGNSYYILIDGHEYGYKPIKGTTDQIAKKFKMILKHSPGKALDWLKKNAKLISGSKEKKKVNEREFSDKKTKELMTNTIELNEELPSERVPTFAEFIEQNSEKIKKEEKVEKKEDLKKDKNLDPDLGSKYTKNPSKKEDA